MTNSLTNMELEVHHHPQLPKGEKKRFKEYLLEFFMIFLAVTMGFIASNIREHFADKSMEQGYIAGLIKDLAVDTANLRVAISGNQVQIRGLDSLRGISKIRLNEPVVQDSLYHYTDKYVFNNTHDFKFDETTLMQLRNAGGYRLIRNQSVLDSIAALEIRMAEVNDQRTYFFDSLKQLYDLACSIFDLNAGAQLKALPTSTSIILPDSHANLSLYYNKCYMISGTLTSYNRMLENQISYNTRLIAYLKKAYDLD